MKKLLFVISLLFIICACTKPESTPTPTPTKQSQNIPPQASLQKSLPVSITESSCKIGDYDCWDIITDIKQETQKSPNQKGASNPALEKKGLSIIQFFQMGGDQFYTLSNQTYIIIYSDEANEKFGTQGYTSIQDPVSRKMIIYDTKGNITNTKNEITESSCKMGEYDCWDIIKDIKQLSKSNKEAYSALREKGILIVHADMLLDGGSLAYTLSNGISIFINYEMFSDREGTFGYTSIADFTTQKGITYNNEGKIVSTKNVFTESSCKIGKYDCWDIIQDIKKESKKDASKEKAFNPALEKKGLSILSYRKFEDGGSESYLLSNLLEFYIDYKTSSKTQGYTTISYLKSKRELIYDTEGNIVSFGADKVEANKAEVNPDNGEDYI